jgi:hypothetical protein
VATALAYRHFGLTLPAGRPPDLFDSAGARGETPS